MFYSHEILTSRKYGVATVWLVATLGPKSVTKKVNRKAILEVNVKKACETIIQPEAPMALRLQSNLLYGVSRVYSQQCSYVLHDVQSAQNNIKALLKVLKTNELDSDAGKAKPDQLILMDDPAFLPDLAVPAFDFDISNLDVSLEESQRSLVPSVLSQQSRRRSSSVPSQASVIGLVIPSSDASSQRLPPLNDPFFLIGSSAQKTPGGGAVHLYDDINDPFFEDLGFEFDADGNLKDELPATDNRRQPSSVLSHPLGRLSNSAASARVRREHEEALARREQDRFSVRADEGDHNIMTEDDGYNIPEADPFPMMGISTPGQRREVLSEEESPESSYSISAENPIRQRKRKAPKTLKVDVQMEISSNVLRTWQRDYVEMMDAAIHSRNAHRVAAQAKKNADIMIWGNGIGGIGELIRHSGGMAHPLAMFTGNSLKELITGTPSLPSTPTTADRASKRPLDAEDEAERRVRARHEEQDQEVQLGRAFDDELMLPGFDDSTALEEVVARDAPPALQDHPSSAMPWNISASLKSYRASTGGPRSSSIGAFPLAGRYRRDSRLTSGSPLQGRGRTDLQGSEELGGIRMGDHNEEEAPIIENDAEMRDMILGGRRLHDGDKEEGEEAERGSEPALTNTRREREREREQRRIEQEVHGPLAEVDTQTAQNSQWVREAMAREAMNFLDFVENSIRERAVIDSEGGDGDEEEAAINNRSNVLFGQLIPPWEQSRVVAAQAFHHVLTLATKGLLGVEQPVGYGEIEMWIQKPTVVV